MDFLFSKIDPTLLSRPSDNAALIYALFIFLEITYIVLRKRGGRYETRDTTTSILMGTGSAVAGILFGGIGIYLVVQAYNARIMSIETTPLMLILLFFLDDFSFLLEPSVLSPYSLVLGQSRHSPFQSALQSIDSPTASLVQFVFGHGLDLSAFRLARRKSLCALVRRVGQFALSVLYSHRSHREISNMDRGGYEHALASPRTPFHAAAISG